MPETVVPGWWTTGQEARARVGGAGEPVSMGAIGIPLSRCRLEGGRNLSSCRCHVLKRDRGLRRAWGRVQVEGKGDLADKLFIMASSEKHFAPSLLAPLGGVAQKVVRLQGLHSRARSDPAARPSFGASSPFARGFIIGAGGGARIREYRSGRSTREPESHPGRQRRGGRCKAAPRSMGECKLCRFCRVRGALTRLEFASV